MHCIEHDIDRAHTLVIIKISIVTVTYTLVVDQFSCALLTEQVKVLLLSTPHCLCPPLRIHAYHTQCYKRFPLFYKANRASRSPANINGVSSFAAQAH